MVLTALAVDNKTWALVLIPVVLAVLPRQRVRAVGILLLGLAPIYLPVFFLRSGGGGSLGASTGTSIFLFPQLWWWFGSHSWISMHAHEVIVVAAVVVAALWATLRQRPPAGLQRARQGLVLLAAVLLLRAAMDPWDNIYYQLPFLMAVFALERERIPRVSAAVTAALFIATVPLAGEDLSLRVLAYQALAIALMIAIGWRMFAGTGQIGAADRFRGVLDRRKRLAVRGSRRSLDIFPGGVSSSAFAKPISALPGSLGAKSKPLVRVGRKANEPQL
jgi:hypothetical protein